MFGIGLSVVHMALSPTMSMTKAVPNGTTRNKGLGRIYLATPGGYLKVCNVESVTATTIAQIPFDKNSPDKAWWKLWGGVSY